MWRLLDPLLRRMARRLEHLAIQHPSDYAEQLIRSRGNFSSLATVSSDARLDNFATRDDLSVGDYAHIAGEIFLLTPQSRCRIGSYSFLGAESRLWVQRSVTIGNFVLIAPRVDIFDNDSHPLDDAQRRQEAVDHFERNRPFDYRNVAAADVVIDDDVWVGTKSTITKGVHLGQGCVIAAGSVVTRDVEPFTLVGGNPAREIRKLK